MRVLLVSDSPPTRGGVQMVCKELGRQLCRRGHNVATLRPKPQVPALDYSSGTEVFALDQSHRGRMEYSISVALGVFRPDVVHVVSARLPLANRINTMVRRVPWLLSVHNPVPWESMVSCFYGHNRLYYVARNTRYAVNVLAYTIMLRRWRFARALCFSEPVASRLVAYGCKAAKVVVVPLGMPEVTEKLADDREEMYLFRENEYPRILTVAGLAHHKGFHDALQALAGMVTAYPTLRYIIIGSVRDCGYASHLGQIVRRLQLTRHVSFLTNISDSQKNAALKEADLYLQPSHEEGFCLAFLEAAMNTGRLVGTNVGEMPAVAANDPLIRIVPRMNPGTLRQSILTLLGVPVSTEMVTARRMLLGKKYSWSNFAARVTSLYEDISVNPGVPVDKPVEMETMKNYVAEGVKRPDIEP